jgi:hypothetical protein
MALRAVGGALELLTPSLVACSLFESLVETPRQVCTGTRNLLLCGTSRGDFIF